MGLPENCKRWTNTRVVYNIRQMLYISVREDRGEGQI